MFSKKKFMAILDTCVITTTLIWFLLTFIGFLNFFTCNVSFFVVIKNSKFRKKKLFENAETLKTLKFLNLKEVFLVIYFISKRWYASIKHNLVFFQRTKLF